MRLRMLMPAGTVVLAAALAFVPAAGAAGGSTIASAPQVTPGTQYFGDTSTGTLSGDCPADYWSASLAAGDQVTVDWASQFDSENEDYANTLYVYPAGTTDFSINNMSPAQEFSIGSNHRAESIFKANKAGSYPLVFWRHYYCGGGPGGPYDFTVAVKHSTVLALGPVKKLKSGKGDVAIGVHNPDGQPITDPALRVALRASWRGHRTRELAVGSPTNGAVLLTAKLPRSARGKKVTFRAASSGEAYLPARSSSRSLTVKRR